jgi:class 3 adenylate cyclase
MARLENLAIMFVDMAGFAERTARQTREQNKTLLRDFAGLLIPLIARFGGRHVKSIGDALLVAFRSPTDSVRCGMAMHDAIVAYNNERRSHDPIQIRVALNVGEVRLEPDDVFGEAVNIAARVEELTPPGEIYLTGVVYLSMNKAEVPAEHIGERMLKGVPEPVRLFRVPPHKLSRLTPAGEPLDPSPNELPYGGMHRLPQDADVLARLAESLRRAPYVDWGAKARAIPLRPILTGIAALGVASALLAVAYAVIAVKPAPACLRRRRRRIRARARCWPKRTRRSSSASASRRRAATPARSSSTRCCATTPAWPPGWWPRWAMPATCRSRPSASTRAPSSWSSSGGAPASRAGSAPSAPRRC